MNRHNLRERAIHGTPAFPAKIYNNHFDRHTPVLAPLHFHKEFEFCVATRGRLIIQINENNIELSVGEGVFINSEYLHSIVPADDSESGFVAMLFDPDMICSENDIIHSRYISPLMLGNLSAAERLSDVECRMVLDTERIYSEKSHGYEFDVKCNIIKLMSGIIKSAKITTDTSNSRKRAIVKQTIDYIHTGYANPITLSELASNVYVSPEYLCRIFSEISDFSPVEYLNRYRIMQASKLLLKDNTPVSQISSSCGFNNSSYFNKMFMRFIGCTPTEYRHKK